MKYFIGYLITIGLLILLIIFLMRGGGNDQQAPVTDKSLASYASTDAEVSFLNEGPINAASEHEQILITVDQDYVTYQQIIGYDGRVVMTKRFSNTQNAYSAFLSALGHAGFALGDDNESLQNEKGRCPTGHRYIFELNEGTDQIQRTWGTNCSGAKTFLGNQSLTITLFQAQVPNYSTLSQNVFN